MVDAPIELLASPDMVLAKHVEEGLALLNQLQGRAAPGEKAVKNLIACCRAVRDGQPASEGVARGAA